MNEYPGDVNFDHSCRFLVSSGGVAYIPPVIPGILTIFASTPESENNPAAHFPGISLSADFCKQI
jgi:hypothetical protein